MERNRIYCAGNTPAIQYAKHFLVTGGFSVSHEPGWDVKHLLLDVPSFREDGRMRMGGTIDTLLSSLPRDIIIWGGNLSCPMTEGYRTMDLLKDEVYLANNAAITADCAIQIASPMLTATWQESPALVIGWGRIGKTLSKLLKGIGNDVTVATRDPATRAALQSMGYHAIDLQEMKQDAEKYRVLFNTAPEMVIAEADTGKWERCVKIDLATRKGIAGENVVWARGLPGIHAPESSGRLIAGTIARLWKEKFE